VVNMIYLFTDMSTTTDTPVPVTRLLTFKEQAMLKPKIGGKRWTVDTQDRIYFNDLIRWIGRRDRQVRIWWDIKKQSYGTMALDKDESIDAIKKIIEALARLGDE